MDVGQPWKHSLDYRMLAFWGHNFGNGEPRGSAQIISPLNRLGSPSVDFRCLGNARVLPVAPIRYPPSAIETNPLSVLEANPLSARRGSQGQQFGIRCFSPGLWWDRFREHTGKPGTAPTDLESF